MKDVIFDDFQNAVDESLLRHKSIIDIMTKFQESNGRINRAIAKSVTNCGCIKVNAVKQYFPTGKEDMDIKDLKKYLKSHVDGKLCDNCRDILEREIGNNLFYLTSLCNILNLNLFDIILKEYDKMNTLGKYTFR
ncbi:DUF1573 domain-containing protein [Clostridium fermenticellae]|uniref:DUF1573 domain-containing protein n=1 Tax=Clostridium fermenticellae TaxID=2068654 RepID=A0A386H0N6_9CLOT|nr:DUF1573 domain-containing protein [Clostridium fermenticellae]AYD39229.1 DUF1573 domain-containing protein [Clostridium fermenticellae]